MAPGFCPVSDCGFGSKTPPGRAAPRKVLKLDGGPWPARSVFWMPNIPAALMQNIRTTLFLIGLCMVAFVARPASAQTSTDSPDDGVSPGKLQFLPAPISDGLDVNLWGWLGYNYEQSDEHSSYWDGQIQLDLNKSFGDRFAITTDINFIDANNYRFGQLEQAFATLMLFEQSGTLLTVGKFNAPFGVEPRDFWNRSTGTTSLLFGAQPQDLIGIMLTQPIGQTGLKIRAFVANEFEGHADFNQPPSAGITLEYRPVHEWSFAVTNWVGPGFVPNEAEGEYSGPSSYRRINKDAYGGGSSAYTDSTSVINRNYLGPELEARQGGTLYFVEARAIWIPRPDFNLAAEGLFGTTGSSDGGASWAGAMILANYNLTDRWRLFGRWSFLNDGDGLITGIQQRRHEVSGGLAFEVYHNVEMRGEYRHDFSRGTDDVDTVSIHLSFGI